jgi:hypothetical protein
MVVALEVEGQRQLPDQLLLEQPRLRVLDPGDEGVPAHPVRERVLSRSPGESPLTTDRAQFEPEVVRE